MNEEHAMVVDLISQLLTTDYRGMEHKRRCLIQLLQNPGLAQKALSILTAGQVKEGPEMGRAK